MAANTSNASASDLVGWMAGPETRGTLTLVWSCVLTIFACTWTVLHLNVPGRDESPFTVVLRKIKWMAINILFPEFIFAKAVCDLRLALEELREFDENVRQNKQKHTNLLRKWTVPDYMGMHSHEWSWELEYPLGAYWLYRMLRLKPPKESFNETTLPGWIRNVFSWLQPEDGASNDHSDFELQTRPDSKKHTCSNRKSYSSNSREVGSADEDPNSTPSATHREASQSQTSEGIRPVQWRGIQKWTVVHSYYAQMGGILYPVSWFFTHRNPDGSVNLEPPYYCCTASMLTPRYKFKTDRKHHPFDGLILSEKDIGDKSKADWVLKTIAIAQVSWLILSVIARGIMDLPITQLEIATVSFAVMAIPSYMANWWKPKDISHATLLQPPIYGDNVESDRPRAYATSFVLRLRSPAEAAKKAEEIVDTFQRIPNDFLWMESDSPLVFVLMAIASLVFGGLHCLAWDFEFPSQTELLCWRIATVLSSTLPAVTLGISVICHLLANVYTDSQLVSILSSKLEPLNQLHPDYWKYIREPCWQKWDKKAVTFLIESPTGSRDWENQPPAEITAQQTKPNSSEGTFHWYFQAHLILFAEEWKNIQESTPFAARASRKAWFENGRWMERFVWFDGVFDFWREYESFLKRKYAIHVPGMHDYSYIAFMINAYIEAAKEVPRWEKFQRVCDQASLVLSIFSGVIYTIARLVILILLFTCLRETPAGVYQVTPWVNFLPSLS